MVRTFFVACLAVATIASTASAQTRFFSGEITGGSIAGFISGVEIGGQISLTGPGFHIVGSIANAGRLPGKSCSDFPCVPGDDVSLSSFFIGTVFDNLTIVGGRVTVNGETLEPANVEMGLFTLEAEPVTIPKGNRRKLVLSTPFVLMSGAPQEQILTIRVRVFRADESLTAEPWAVGDISGNGVVTGIYERFSVRSPLEAGTPAPRKVFLYALREIIYSFLAPWTPGGSAK